MKAIWLAAILAAVATTASAQSQIHLPYVPWSDQGRLEEMRRDRDRIDWQARDSRRPERTHDARKSCHNPDPTAPLITPVAPGRAAQAKATIARINSIAEAQSRELTHIERSVIAVNQRTLAEAACAQRG